MTIAELDHVIIAVRDLTAAEAAMARLGFVITPRGVHSEYMGTENSTFVFKAPNYVELLGVRGETPANARLRGALDEGQALFGAALKTSDAASSAAALMAAGLSNGAGVSEFSRPVECADGPQDAVFRTTYLTSEATQELFVFVCEHQTPHLVWRPEYIAQENAVTGLKRIVGTASDLAAATAMWEAIVPGKTTASKAMVTVDLGAMQFQVLTPEDYENDIGPLPPGDPGLGALVFASSDMDRTRAVLGDLASETDAGLRVGPEAAAGVTFLFEPA